MTKRESIHHLFKAYGAQQPDRADIYVRDLEGHPASWTDLEVSAGCTRARQRWKHASLPPIGVLLSACFEIREEDQRHARGKVQRLALAADPDWIAENERAHAKLISALFAAGLDYCDATQRWVAAGDGVHLPPDHSSYRPIAFAKTQQAFDAMQRGELVGDAEVVAQRQRAKAKAAAHPIRSKRMKRIEPITDAMVAVFD